MGNDDDRRAPRLGLAQSQHQRLDPLRVEIGVGLVEDQQLRVAEQSPGQCHPLAGSRREQVVGSADDRVVSGR